MRKTQKDWVIKQLIQKGKISRNQALKNYISRLGSYICQLRQAGFEIIGGYKKTKNGEDYVYTLIK
jgi:hypothetical protein